MNARRRILEGSHLGHRHRETTAPSHNPPRHRHGVAHPIGHRVIVSVHPHVGNGNDRLQETRLSDVRLCRAGLRDNRKKTSDRKKAKKPADVV